MIKPCSGIQEKNLIESQVEKVHLTRETLQLIFDHMQKNLEIFTIETQQIINSCHKSTSELFPEMIQPQINAEEIEEVANKYFQKVYTGESTV